MKDLLNFINSRKLIVLATVDEKNNPWVCNLYFSNDNNLNIYLVTAPTTNHSKHIQNNRNVAFSITWYDENNLGNRIGIQGKGICSLLGTDEEMKEALEVHIKKYPIWEKSINFENMKINKIESRMYKLKPNYIKFWNDKLYGEEVTKEFTF